MPSDPTNLLFPARAAYPKFAAVLDALASVIAADPLAGGSDLGPVLANARPGQRIVLAPGASYVLTGTPIIKADNVALIGSGNPVAITPAPGASSGIVVQGDGCEFAGLNLSGPVVAFRLYGSDPKVRTAVPLGTSIHDCTFDATLVTGVLIDAWADNVRISNCQFGLVGGAAVYCTADNLQLVHCTFAGSQGEHCVRFDLNASTLHRPANATLFSCDMTNHNRPGKECLTAREIDGLSVIGCTFDGWVSAGQAGSEAAVHARNLVFFACTWKTLRPGGALGEFKHDTDVTVDACTVPASATEPAFTIDARGTITAIANTMIVPPGMTPRPLALARDAEGKVNENGTRGIPKSESPKSESIPKSE